MAGCQVSSNRLISSLLGFHVEPVPHSNSRPEHENHAIRIWCHRRLPDLGLRQNCFLDLHFLSGELSASAMGVFSSIRPRSLLRPSRLVWFLSRQTLNNSPTNTHSPSTGSTSSTRSLFPLPVTVTTPRSSASSPCSIRILRAGPGSWATNAPTLT